jgi:hypothetical protein
MLSLNQSTRKKIILEIVLQTHISSSSSRFFPLQKFLKPSFHLWLGFAPSFIPVYLRLYKHFYTLNIVACIVGGYIRPVSGQRLGKHVPAAMVTHVTEETECCLRGPRRGVIKRRELGQPVRFETSESVIGSQSESKSATPGLDWI